MSTPAVRSHGSWSIGRTIGASLILSVLVPGCADFDESAGIDADAASCPPGQQSCDGRCVVTATDKSHCGACGVACPTGQSCVAGICVGGAGDSSGAASGAMPGTGGAAAGGAATGGVVGAGGFATAGAAGGSVANGGAPGTGGIATGGATTGGTAGTGGIVTGGATTGGTTMIGRAAMGGAALSGGALTGGVVTGGVAGEGGAQLGGAQTGGAQTGGEATGGEATGGEATGGEATSGNVPIGVAAGGVCSRTVGSCIAPEVVVTEVDVGSSVAWCGGEGDTEPLPRAIAAMPSGGSRPAWLGTDARVHVAELDCDDHLVGTPFGLPGVELQDVYADEGGGVVLLTRDASNGGTANCGSGRLCGGTSSPCRGIWMVRFDGAGDVAWETQVTNLSDSRAGYDDGAIFVWWYQHHGRLASDGSNYADYFGAAIYDGSSCVDDHEGDRMQAVGPSGTLLSSHPGAFDWGLCHAWTSRIVWDPRSSHFVMAAATDNERRIVKSNYTTIAAGACDGTVFNGDQVPSRSGGYWDAWSQGGTIRLEHFGPTGPFDQTIPGRAARSTPTSSRTAPSTGSSPGPRARRWRRRSGIRGTAPLWARSSPSASSTTSTRPARPSSTGTSPTRRRAAAPRPSRSRG